MIGRTQVIKEMLCELKKKVKEAEDGWTHKDTKETKESLVGVVEINRG